MSAPTPTPTSTTLHLSWRLMAHSIYPPSAYWAASPDLPIPKKNSVSQTIARQWLDTSAEELQRLIKIAQDETSNLNTILSLDTTQLLVVEDSRFPDNEAIVLASPTIDDEYDDMSNVVPMPRLAQANTVPSQADESIWGGLPVKRRINNGHIRYTGGCAVGDQRKVVQQIIIPRVLRKMSDSWRHTRDLTAWGFFLYHMVVIGVRKAGKANTSKEAMPTTGFFVSNERLHEIIDEKMDKREEAQRVKRGEEIQEVKTSCSESARATAAKVLEDSKKYTNDRNDKLKNELRLEITETGKTILQNAKKYSDEKYKRLTEELNTIAYGVNNLKTIILDSGPAQPGTPPPYTPSPLKIAAAAPLPIRVLCRIYLPSGTARVPIVNLPAFEKVFNEKESTQEVFGYLLPAIASAREKNHRFALVVVGSSGSIRTYTVMRLFCVLLAWLVSQGVEANVTVTEYERSQMNTLLDGVPVNASTQAETVSRIASAGMANATNSRPKPGNFQGVLVAKISATQTYTFVAVAEAKTSGDREGTDAESKAESKAESMTANKDSVAIRGLLREAVLGGRLTKSLINESAITRCIGGLLTGVPDLERPVILFTVRGDEAYEKATKGTISYACELFGQRRG